MQLEVHRVGHADIVASSGPVVFRVLRQSAATELADVDEARTIIAAKLERYTDVGAFVIVEHGTPPPSAEVRRYAQQVFGEFGDRLTMCHVTLGLGFWANAARLAIAAIPRLTGTPSLTAKTVEEGAQLLAAELIGVDPDMLVETYAQLVRRLDAGQTQVA